MNKQGLLRALTAITLTGFLVGTYNGRLAVWKDDDPQPYRVYPCPVYLFPKAEREALRKGIRINDMNDLSNFLENFMS